ncbi:MAG TPA: FHA domain-containing protein [Anaerolineales bacterium]|nr:FHA domain-containing protein [Anaerolineales bacterium]
MRATRLGGLALGVCLLASGWPTVPARAQASALVRATAPTAEAFPQVHFFLSVDDAEGVRIPALPPTSFSILEDGNPVPAFDLQESDVGVRVVYALNTASPMRRRDPLGQTRFEVVRAALMHAWSALSSGSGLDDLTLVSSDGPLATHQTSSRGLRDSLETYEPSYPPASGYGLLIGALDYAASPPPRPGMETHLVFVTTLVDRPVEQDLANAAAAAADLHTVIHAVLVGTPEQALVLEAIRLREAAIASGGTFTIFDPVRGLDSLAAFLASRRTRYEVQYLSPAQLSGTHTVEVRLQAEDLQGQSEPVSFDVHIQPPQVAFIQPPTHILRKTEDPNVPLTDIPPTQQALRLLVTFPDLHTRGLVETQLLVDGAQVAARTEAPFDSITWDLSGLLESGRHRIQAAVVDRQGLRATTETVTVDVEVIPGPQGLAALRPAAVPLALSFLLAFSTIGWVNLWVALQRRSDWLGSLAAARPLRRARLGAQARDLPPEALLIPLGADGADGVPYPWDGAELTIGSDPSQCGLLLDDPSVSPIHARLVRRASGQCLLRDQNSTAGTWVNDEPVPEDGRALNHNDRIHIGRVALRFRWTTPPALAVVRVHRRSAASSEPDA